MLPGPTVPGYSLVSFHFLWAILCLQAVVIGRTGKGAAWKDPQLIRDLPKSILRLPNTEYLAKNEFLAKNEYLAKTEYSANNQIIGK